MVMVACYVMMTTLLFTSLNVLVKEIGTSYPVIEIVFFRCLISIIPPLFLIRNQGVKGFLKMEKPGLHLFCGVTGMAALCALFTACRLMPIADAQTIAFSSSLFVTALAVPLIKERVGFHRWIAVIIGFVGVLVVARPSGDLINLGAFLALTFSFLSALVMLYQRVLTKWHSPATTVLYFSVLGSVFCGMLLPFFWVTPTLEGFIKMSIIGLAGGVAQTFLMLAFKKAPASYVSPFLYTALIWGMGADMLFWGHSPSIMTVTGGIIIIACALSIVYRENRQQVTTERRY